ncbi:hypothetical protein [Photobacterium phosphoreum]|uniref:hypothetical protein n=1 Tax=Photobacterium phosphoreum TaxID=659 RepID=UPI00243121F3|nr:hypothetical protein [Photobacterium phosphoreum]
MDQVYKSRNEILNNIRCKLLIKNNEVREAIISEAQGKLPELLIELELYQQEFEKNVY